MEYEVREVIKKHMKEKNLSDLTDQELLQEARKLKAASITNAVLIGVLIGIIIYSVAVSSWGFLTLILVYFIYRLMNNSKVDREELERVLKARNL